MSLARVTTVKKSRKPWVCGKCRTELPVGSPVLSFAVGFRGREQKRCTSPACAPSRADLESSAVATVYSAMDGIDWSDCNTAEEFTEALELVAEACREVAEEYESNEMYDINEQLQERAETLNSAADELESTSIEEEPEEPAEDASDDDKEEYSTAYNEWRERAEDEAQGALDNVELP